MEAHAAEKKRLEQQLEWVHNSHATNKAELEAALQKKIEGERKEKQKLQGDMAKLKVRLEFRGRRDPRAVLHDSRR